MMQNIVNKYLKNVNDINTTIKSQTITGIYKSNDHIQQNFNYLHFYTFKTKCKTKCCTKKAKFKTLIFIIANKNVLSFENVQFQSHIILYNHTLNINHVVIQYIQNSVYFKIKFIQSRF